MEQVQLHEVQGFRVAGVHAGLKKEGALDVALLVSDAPCVAAGAFTKNLVRAAPVLYDEACLATAATAIRAVAINARNANAVTGEQGLRDAAEMARVTEEALSLPTGSALVMSTGVIGVPMPMPTIRTGITRAVGALGRSTADWQRASEAIMTTDTHPKRAAARLTLGGQRVTLAGIAKGAGMIHPDMATMLGLIATDVAIALAPLRAALRYAVERSYNCISVDGDSSTNDTQLVLANGVAGNPLIDSESHPDFAPFRDALCSLCVALAQQIAWDGEGATKALTIQVCGAPTWEAARAVGRTIATSPLVKTAMYGRDANWGRVLAAAGRAGVPFDPTRTALWFGDLQLLRDGAPVGVDEVRALEILSQRDICLTLWLGAGEASACVWSCDFSHEYVSVNADYRT